jgi:hypothetical protein
LAFDGYWWCVSKDHLDGFTHWLPHWALPMPRTGGAAGRVKEVGAGRGSRA